MSVPHIKAKCDDCGKEGYLDEMNQVEGNTTKYKWTCEECFEERQVEL